LLLRLDASFLDRGGPLYELGPNESIEILGPAPVDFCPGLLESLLGSPSLTATKDGKLPILVMGGVKSLMGS
jgi:hypothetical protein